jgi:hypothetical protein
MLPNAKRFSGGLAAAHKINVLLQPQGRKQCRELRLARGPAAASAC